MRRVMERIYAVSFSLKGELAIEGERLMNLQNIRAAVFTLTLGLGCGGSLPLNSSPRETTSPDASTADTAPPPSLAPQPRSAFPQPSELRVSTDSRSCISNTGPLCAPIMQTVLDRDPFYNHPELARRDLRERYPIINALPSLTQGAISASGYQPRVEDVATFTEVGLNIGSYLVIAVNDPREYTQNGINASHPGYLIWFRLLSPRPREQAHLVYAGAIQHVDWPNDREGHRFGAISVAALSDADGTGPTFQNASLAGNSCTPLLGILGMAFIPNGETGRLYVAGRGLTNLGSSAIGAFAVGGFQFTATKYGYDFVTGISDTNLCPPDAPR